MHKRRQEPIGRHRIGRTAERVLGIAQRYCDRRDTRAHTSSVNVGVGKVMVVMGVVGDWRV